MGDWKREMPIERSKSGLACLWEWGGGQTKRGQVRIITAPDGGMPKAIARRQERGGNHALIPLRKGMWVVEIIRRRGAWHLDCWKVLDIQDSVVVVDREYTFQEGEWSPECPTFLNPAINAGKRKACVFHASRAAYVQ